MARVYRRGCNSGETLVPVGVDASVCGCEAGEVQPLTVDDGLVADARQQLAAVDWPRHREPATVPAPALRSAAQPEHAGATLYGPVAGGCSSACQWLPSLAARAGGVHSQRRDQ